MNNVYIALLSTLVDADGTRIPTAPRSRQHHWHVIPSTSPVRVLLVVDFADEAARDAFEAQPGVLGLADVMQLSAMAPAAVSFLSPLGAQAGDTVLAFLQRLRANWPMARPWFD